MPSTKYFCMKMNKMTTGNMEITPAAAMPGQSVEFSPTNACMPTLTVRSAGLLKEKTSGRKKAF